ncbi:LLM class flavin-dependent oxidoreductase [Galbibacter pacificus]|uniref:LLM class flavin-dependent oxidoreductase n=1 Tax=Galbibacter pacificus TaxID=2996052 RepID=A0ABT6FRW2_9FLAO|nr:LLM class flavin-dependent oxidoreductase [Galbibacter pacificus]MDG3582876.1 LLM class flavin-dependent oxidoreductase [Galbibacter pacificus]MDG3586005.1 LLM class flavin-dependent oxidoreductase [Galbibacter pacificus]
MKKIQLGLLDFGKRKSEYSSMGKVLDVIDYAIEADQLGFSRFWLSEHHNFSREEAWSSPQMLLPLILSETQRINVGMAGVLLNYYSSYSTATNFKMLANLFPSRVDLGFAAGTPPMKISQLLCQNKFDERPNTLPTKLQEISDFYHAEDEIAKNDHIIIPPFKGRVPQLYMLSNSFNKTEEALKLKLNISKSIFHNKFSLVYQKDTIQQYREKFYNRYGDFPKVSIAFTGVCAETEQKAKNIAKESGYKNFFNAIIGTPEMFYEQLKEHQYNFDVDEFIFHDCDPLNSRRIDTLKKLSHTFNLTKEKSLYNEI